jgi:hypothetical protein
VSTVEWGVEVTLVELKDIQLPETHEARDGPPGRSRAREARQDHQRRRRVTRRRSTRRGVGHHDGTPAGLQLRNLQSLVEIGVDKNTTVVFPAPLMTTIAELGAFLAREKAAADGGTSIDSAVVSLPRATVNGS